MGRRLRVVFLTMLLSLAWVGAGCSGGPDPVAADTGGSETDVVDAGGGDGGGEDVSGTDVEPPKDLPLCAPCLEDDECGGAEDYCVQLFVDEGFCGRGCLPGSGECPEDYFCAELGEGVHQCIPRALTCVDRCGQTQCPGTQICDPLTGECGEGLGLCETGCLVDGHCAGQGSLCVGTGSADGETFCATGCDATSPTRQCPVDYMCIAVDPDRNPAAGVCYPIAGTCVDRCSAVACPQGQNCDPVTGGCSSALYGSCERGCQSHAECGGQNDLCFDLGIGQGAHCWADCSRSSCAEGYRCVALQGTTIQICIPTNESCASCYDSSCFPDGVCHPDGGACMLAEPDCNIEGCPEGALCEPVSGRCVEPGETCEGSRWATDCDNVVTRCTTRRADTVGLCAQICLNDSECSDDQRCISTTHGRLCLEADLGGPSACSTIHETTSNVGQPCGPGGSFCGSPATQCIQAGNLPGFCSLGCNSDTQCPGDSTCAPGPTGASICLPTQCLCAGHTGLSSAQSALERALEGAALSQCDVYIDAAIAEGLPRLTGFALQLPSVADGLRFPLPSMGETMGALNTLATTEDTPSGILEAAAQLAGFDITATPSSTSFADETMSALSLAVAELITAAGGIPEMAVLEAAAGDVPESFQAIAAPIIRSVADGLAARNLALSQAGLTGADLDALFVSAPYLFLTGTDAQNAAAPDLDDPILQAKLEAFPVQAFARAGANIAATVETVTAGLEVPAEGWDGFTFIVDTPAGKVILGDTNDTVYDQTANPALAGPIAVLIDAGGNDVYRVDAGANTSSANGISLLVDLGGDDTYAYVEAPDALDGDAFLVSDADGRKTPQGALNRYDGPISLSATARQGAGRFGIGMILDLGEGNDMYRSLRMSQGAAIFGVGLLFDGGGNDTFEAEALAQGAAIGGLGILYSAAGDDHFRLWHAGQGFGTAAGYGLLFNRAGNDSYEAVRGETSGAGVLYLSDAFAGRTNRSLAQGASAGGDNAQSVAAGYGLLYDDAGHDTYRAGTHAQGYGTTYGFGILDDRAGDDTYSGLGHIQGVGELLGAGIFIDRAGLDILNAETLVLQYGQGAGIHLGWGFFALLDGDNQITYMAPGGGSGVEGGMGFAIVGPGDDTHVATSASWGFANRSAQTPDPIAGALTLGFFLDLGGATDTYQRGELTDIANGALWRQPDPTDADGFEAGVIGVGVDMP